MMVSGWKGQFPAATLFAVVVAVAGCGSDGSETGPGPSVAATQSDAPVTGADGVSLDACSMLSEEDIAPLIGPGIEGKSTSTDPDMPSCVWENPANYYSVTLNIGNQDTAPNGTVPEEPGLPKEPGPDGIQFYAPGAAEFAAGGRLNDLQVANGTSKEESDAAVVALVRKVTPQIGG